MMAHLRTRYNHSVTSYTDLLSKPPMIHRELGQTIKTYGLVELSNNTSVWLQAGHTFYNAVCDFCGDTIHQDEIFMSQRVECVGDCAECQSVRTYHLDHLVL